MDRKGEAVHAGGRNFRRQERGMGSLLEDEPFLKLGVLGDGTVDNASN